MPREELRSWVEGSGGLTAAAYHRMEEAKAEVDPVLARLRTYH